MKSTIVKKTSAEWKTIVLDYYTGVSNRFLTAEFQANPKMYAYFQLITSPDPKTQFLTQTMQVKDPLQFLDMKKQIEKVREDVFSYISKTNQSEEEPLIPKEIMLKMMDIGKKTIAEQIFGNLQSSSNLEKFANLRESGDVITAKWLSSQYQMSQELMSVNAPIRKNDNQIVISWPILIDCVVRDYELLNQLIFATGLNMDPRATSYATLRDLFFPNEGKLKNDLIELCLKTWVRHRLVHHQFAVDQYNKTIDLFYSFAQPEYRLKTISFIQLTKICGELNRILWVFLVVLWDLYEEKGEHYQFLPHQYESAINRLRAHPYYHRFKELTIIQKNLENYSFLFQNPPESPSFVHKNRIWHLGQSFIMHISLNEKKIPPFDLQLAATYRTLYLTGYELMKHRIMLPLIQVEYPLKDLSKKKDGWMLRQMKTLHQGQYKDLVEDIDPQLRNALAHNQFHTPKNDPYTILYYNEETQSKEQQFAFGFSLQSVFYQFEEVFSESSDKFLLNHGVAKLIHALFFDAITNFPVGFFLSQAKLIEKFSKAHELQALCYFAESLNLMNQPNPNSKLIIQYISKGTSIFELDPTKCEVGWAWILLVKHKGTIEVRKNWIHRMFQHFTVLPPSSDAIRKVNSLKAFLYWNLFQDAKKATTFMRKADIHEN